MSLMPCTSCQKLPRSPNVLCGQLKDRLPGRIRGIGVRCEVVVKRDILLKDHHEILDCGWGFLPSRSPVGWREDGAIERLGLAPFPLGQSRTNGVSQQPGCFVDIQLGPDLEE